FVGVLVALLELLLTLRLLAGRPLFLGLALGRGLRIWLGFLACGLLVDLLALAIGLDGLVLEPLLLRLALLLLLLGLFLLGLARVGLGWGRARGVVDSSSGSSEVVGSGALVPRRELEALDRGDLGVVVVELEEALVVGLPEQACDLGVELRLGPREFFVSALLVV